MVKAFSVIQPAGNFPALFANADVTSDVVLDLIEGNLVYIDAQSESNQLAQDGWTHVEFRPNPAANGDVGWLQDIFIGEPKEFDVAPIDVGTFVRACARAEIKANAGEQQQPAILADYLIALALIETELSKFGNRLEGTSAVGPYQLTEEEWSAFLQENPSSGLAQFSRFEALAQIIGAVFVTQSDWAKLEAGAGAAGLVESNQSYIPSFLMLFQARLIGAEAAFGLDQLHRSGNPHILVSKALADYYPDETERKALINRRRRFLRQSEAGDATTVDEFIEKTSAVLADAFKAAFSKLRDHFPEFAIPPSLNAAQTPWLEFAEQERIYWERSDVTIASALGKQRVAEYFQTTSYHPNTVEPWCGAFASWCLSKAGAPIIKHGAKASNWKSWGAVELRKGGLTDPAVKAALRGAVVVLHPRKGNTSSSGHVCFALNRVEASSKLKVVSGNSSNTVRIDAFNLSRVASIRALVKVAEPTGDDRLILARTIYGEARSEGQAGREAVAQVIMNRAQSNRYPDDIKSVCLQPWQFSCWNVNDPNRAKIVDLMPGANALFDACLAVADAAIAGSLNHLTEAVLHYYADYIPKPSWVKKSPNAVMERKIGRHLFYRGIA